MGGKGHGSAEDISQEELWSHGIHELAGATGQQEPPGSRRESAAGAGVGRGGQRLRDAREEGSARPRGG